MANGQLTEKQIPASGLHLPLSVNGADQWMHTQADEWAVSPLIDFIIKNHHVYVTEAFPKIMDLLEKVVTEYGLTHPELEEVFVTFHSLTIHFCAQMRKEEQELFPVIRELVRAKENQKGYAYFPFESIRSQIENIEQDHSMIEECLANIRKLTKDFTVPATVCNAYWLLFQWLEAFEKDIHQHEYLENDVLFARAISLEDSMR